VTQVGEEERRRKDDIKSYKKGGRKGERDSPRLSEGIKEQRTSEDREGKNRLVAKPEKEKGLASQSSERKTKGPDWKIRRGSDSNAKK